MEASLRRLIISHAIVLVVAAVAGFFWTGVQGALSVGSGFVAYSIPVVVFSILVSKAVGADSARFLGRVLLAEVVKWALAAGLLAGAFASGVFLPVPLLAGFILSVLVQVFVPILVKRGSKV